MKESITKKIVLDPRAALFILVFANIIAFMQKCLLLEICWIVALTVLTLACGRMRSGIKWFLGYCFVLFLQRYIMPVSPKIIAVSLTIFLNYARRMFPCLIVGSLIIKTISLRKIIVGLRRLNVPQKLIIPISVTLRYFPTIREETGYIRDAMRLRNVKGLKRAEALTIPLMILATETAEELSAAAVTRGIENPVKKTSVVQIHMTWYDWFFIVVSVIFSAAAYLI
jgi:energy-coupling factor transporter transmembrane protein EcfT